MKQKSVVSTALPWFTIKSVIGLILLYLKLENARENIFDIKETNINYIFREMQTKYVY